MRAVPHVLVFTLEGGFFANFLSFGTGIPHLSRGTQFCIVDLSMGGCHVRGKSDNCNIKNGVLQ